MTNEIEYRYVKGKGWVAGYKQVNPFAAVDFSEIEQRILRTQYGGTIVRYPRAVMYADAI